MKVKAMWIFNFLSIKNKFDFIKIEGSKLQYELFEYPQLERIKSFLPDFVNLGSDEMLPGLFSGTLPYDPIGNEGEISSLCFDELSIQDIKIKIDIPLNA